MTMMCVRGHCSTDMAIALYKTREVCSLTVSVSGIKWKGVGSDVIMPNRATRIHPDHRGSLMLAQNK